MDDVLVIQAARFGDLIQTRRLILSLQREYEVHLALDRSLAPLAGHVYPGVVLHKLVFHGNLSQEACRQNSEQFRKLREIGFKAIYNCNFSPLTSAMCRLFPTELIYGYRPAHDSKGGLLCSPWARLGFRISGMRRAAPLNLVDFWANFTSDPVLPESVNPASCAGGRGIGLAVSGRVERRSLPLDVCAKVLEISWKLLDRPHVKLFGTSQELPKAHKLMRMVSPELANSIRNLCGQTDWPALLEEMHGLDLLLTPDTGLMHLAAFMGVPVIAFFLSSACCHETGPYGAGHRIFQSAPACSPCLESEECPNRIICSVPFSSDLFPRAFARAVQCKPVDSMPGNLQLWRSNFDDAGLALQMLAGRDHFAELRHQARSIIKSYLGLGYREVADTDLLEKLLPESEWMLPARRYC